MIIVNTKNYKKGNELLKLAQTIEQNDLKIILAVPALDVRYITGRSALTIFAQHVDYIHDAKSTGHISANSVHAAGAFGTLLNHSERPLAQELLRKTIEQCKQAGLTTVVCADSLKSAQDIAQYKPHAIAFEDPQLISTGKSITSFKAHDIAKFIAFLKGKSIIPICGAGISSIEDVRAAYAMGCKGVLIASAIADVPQSKAESFIAQIGSFER